MSSSSARACCSSSTSIRAERAPELASRVRHSCASSESSLRSFAHVRGVAIAAHPVCARRRLRPHPVHPLLRALLAAHAQPLQVDADEDRKPRTAEDMEREAHWLREFFERAETDGADT